MAKLFLLINLSLLFSLSSCLKLYKYTNYFTDDILEECLVTDLVKPVEASNIKATSERCITYETTLDGFYKNVNNVYEYLKEKDLILGYRGDVISTFFGGIPTYEFYRSTRLEEHVKRNRLGEIMEHGYEFIYGDGMNEETTNLSNHVELSMVYEDGLTTMYFTTIRNSLHHFEFTEKPIYINELFPWLAEIENVSSVKIVGSNNLFRRDAITREKSDIINIFPHNYMIRRHFGKIYNNENISTVYFYTNDDQTYKIKIVDRYILFDGIYYEMNTTNMDCFWFDEYDFKYTFLDETEYIAYDSTNCDNAKLVSLAGIVCEKIKPIDLPEAYTLDTIYGKITIYNKYYFKIDNFYYYQVTSEKNFDFLFE